jgi:hypothetical protein
MVGDCLNTKIVTQGMIAVTRLQVWINWRGIPPIPETVTKSTITMYTKPGMIAHRGRVELVSLFEGATAKEPS